MKPAPGNPRLRRVLEGIAMVLMSVSAILFQQSATRPWAEARAGDGRRLEVSPIGIVDFGLGTTGTPARECRWWPRLGDSELCEVTAGGETGMARLRRAYPLTVVSLWTSVLALFLVALRVPRQLPWLGVFVTAAVPVLAVTGLWSFATGSRAALVVLANATTQVVPRGFGAVFMGALLVAIALGLLLVSRLKPRAPLPDVRPF